LSVVSKVPQQTLFGGTVVVVVAAVSVVVEVIVVRRLGNLLADALAAREADRRPSLRAGK
jgi:hypothetical protein